MARREIIANKIEKFNDNPENFHTWKIAFKSMIHDVYITPQEELSLLTEYTSNESKQLVQKLRNAYTLNPFRGVEEVWGRLEERFGSNIVLTKTYLDKLTHFPRIGYKDSKKLLEFADILLGLHCKKEDGQLSGLKVLDEPIFLKPVTSKLPNDIQARWQTHAYNYNKEHRADYPPFSEFFEFIQHLSRQRNDPNLMIDNPEHESPQLRNIPPRQTYKTTIEPNTTSNSSQDATYNPQLCILHGTPHPLSECRTFRAKSMEERKNLIREHRLCFRCLASNTHIAKDCQFQPKCTECGSEKHLAALHLRSWKTTNADSGQGGEQNEEQHGSNQLSTSEITAKCTEICGNNEGGRSCSKICLANIYRKENPDQMVKAYVIVDDQSNCSLAKPELFDRMNNHGVKQPYALKTCSGTTATEGRRANDWIIESLDGLKSHCLPTITECDKIPDSRDEIPTREIAEAYPHLRAIASHIPAVQSNADILLLVGRDAAALHKVRESRNGRGNQPWAQRLDLGWVILGNACLDGVHQPHRLSTFKTNISLDGRATIFEPCPNKISIEPASEITNISTKAKRNESFYHGKFSDGVATNVFQRTDADNKPGLSIEDRKFLEIMKAGARRNASGSWIAPLPLRNKVSNLPDSRTGAYRRLKSTTKMLERKPEMKSHYLEFMKNIIDNEHAEVVPPTDLASDKPCWYLPNFGVYHPQKPSKIRVVFDSAAEIDGISLNKLLLSGPDQQPLRSHHAFSPASYCIYGRCRADVSLVSS